MSAPLDQGVSVVVPTYNEAPNLRALVTGLKAALEGSVPYEIIIADDRSPDGTAHGAELLASELSLPLRALARYACVVVIDADLSHDPAEVPGLTREVLEGRCDVAVASRYAADSQLGSWPLRRRLLSRIGTRLARSLAAVADPLSGFFACRRQLLTGEIALQPRGYKILLELLGRAPGLRVVERPTRFADRKGGRSKLRWRQKLQIPRQFVSLLAWRVATLDRARRFAKKCP